MKVDVGLNLYFKIMLRELKERRLIVKVIPVPDPQYSSHKIRSVEETNPEWYQELCSRYVRNRRSRKEKYSDTEIKRNRVIGILKTLVEGKRSVYKNNKYIGDLIEFAGAMKKENDEKEAELLDVIDLRYEA